MDEWPDDLVKVLDQLLEPTVLAIEDFLSDFQQTVEEMGEVLTTEIVTTLELLWSEEEFFSEVHHSSPATPSVDLEENYGWLNPKIVATTNVHPACVGCQHYHGRVYNNSILVCGMHPYGADNAHCPDWEGEEKT